MRPWASPFFPDFNSFPLKMNESVSFKCQDMRGLCTRKTFLGFKFTQGQVANHTGQHTQKERCWQIHKESETYIKKINYKNVRRKHEVFYNLRPGENFPGYDSKARSNKTKDESI